jgi:hypothetical protein
LSVSITATTPAVTHEQPSTKAATSNFGDFADKGRGRGPTRPVVRRRGGANEARDDAELASITNLLPARVEGQTEEWIHGVCVPFGSYPEPDHPGMTWASAAGRAAGAASIRDWASSP